MHSTTQASRRMQRLVDWLERQDPRLLVFVLLCANFLRLVLARNEEEYLGLAKAFMDPGWIPGSFSFAHLAAPRVLFEAPVGWALGYLSFEQVAFLGRLLTAGLMAFPVAGLLGRLRLTHLWILVILQLFVALNQSFFASEWIFGDFESKSIAYVLVLWSVIALIDGHFERSALFAALAAYFHILVGGWVFAAILVYGLLSRLPMRVFVRGAAVFGLLVAPLALYLASRTVSENPVIQGIDTNWIYVYFRHPHHIGLFGDWRYFAHQHLPGILMTAVAGGLVVFWRGGLADERIARANRLLIGLISLQLLAVGVGIFDTTGAFLKYYPFRTSALTLLLFLALLPTAVERMTGYPLVMRTLAPLGARRAVLLPTLALLLALGSLVPRLWKNTAESYRLLSGHTPCHTMDQLADYARQHTPLGSVFLLLAGEQRCTLPFMRKARRDVFSNYKIIPVTAPEIYEWYIRLQEAERARSDPLQVLDMARERRVDYLVTASVVEHERLRLQQTVGPYHLYEILPKPDP